MLRHLTRLIFLILPHISFAQISFDFEYNSLKVWEQSDSAHWEISASNSISGNSSLHHSYDNPSSGHDQITLPLGQLNLKQPITWKFKIRHGYNPSASNNWSVFLFADGSAGTITPQNNCNAFILGVNFTGSDDFLKIWEKSGTTNKVISNTDFNWQDSININDFVDFEASFNPPDSWKIILLKNNNQNEKYQLTFSAPPHIDIGNFFGIYYEYSSSQDQKLWFDDLEINGNFIVDTISPNIISTEVQPNIVTLIFSEAIDHNTTTENTIGFDQKIEYQITWESSSQVVLQLSDSLDIDRIYPLFIKGIKDLSGNTMQDTVLSIQYSIAYQNDIVITEFLTDPTPSISLPREEFIEIYNRSNKNFCLKNYSIYVEEKQVTLQSGNIIPGEYAIICDDNDTEEFIGYGKVIQVTSLPNLTKTSGSIALRNCRGQLIHQVQYTDDIFLSDYKKKGGWTLEMIDFNNPCHFFGNWLESEDVSGGTPGKQNSIFGNNKDFEPPQIKSISLESDTTILISLNEQVDSLYTSQNVAFNLSNIEKHKLNNFKNIRATFLNQLESGKLYELKVSGVKDCAGNLIDNNILYPFAKTERIDSLDVVFNEIMFNPETNEPEFIEIVNTSGKFLDLDCVVLAKRKSSGEYDKYKLTEYSTLASPRKFVVLSEKNESMFSKYSINQDALYIEVRNFPQLTNTSGVVALLDTSDRVIDIFEYDESMHFQLLHETKGVALEKINIDYPSLDKSNWHSASGGINYASPGWPNSQLTAYNSELYSPFIIEPQVFSPNDDGYNDELHIQYQFNEPGMLVHIKIFNAKGRLINYLANNYLCGTSGEFTWSGEDFDNRLASNGIHLIFIEYFDLKGNVYRIKKTCVLVK